MSESKSSRLIELGALDSMLAIVISWCTPSSATAVPEPLVKAAIPVLRSAASHGQAAGIISAVTALLTQAVEGPVNRTRALQVLVELTALHNNAILSELAKTDAVGCLVRILLFTTVESREHKVATTILLRIGVSVATDPSSANGLVAHPLHVVTDALLQLIADANFASQSANAEIWLAEWNHRRLIGVTILTALYHAVHHAEALLSLFTEFDAAMPIRFGKIRADLRQPKSDDRLYFVLPRVASSAIISQRTTQVATELARCLKSRSVALIEAASTGLAVLGMQQVVAAGALNSMAEKLFADGGFDAQLAGPIAECMGLIGHHLPSGHRLEFQLAMGCERLCGLLVLADIPTKQVALRAIGDLASSTHWFRGLLTKAGVPEVLNTLHTAQVDASLRDQAVIVADQIQNGTLLYLGEVLKSTGFVLLAVLVFLFQIGGPEAVGMIVYFVPPAAQYVFESVVSVSLAIVLIVSTLLAVAVLLKFRYASYNERRFLSELTRQGSIISSSKTSYSSWPLGVHISKTAAGKFEIRKVVSDGPAAKAGVRPSMTLAQVDGCSTDGWSIAQLSTALYGARGSTVALRLLKPSADGCTSATASDDCSDAAAEQADAERGFEASCAERLTPAAAELGVSVCDPNACTCGEIFRLNVDEDTEKYRQAIKELQYEVDVETELVRVPWIPEFWPGSERAVMQREPRFPRVPGAFGAQFERRLGSKFKPWRIPSDSEDGHYTVTYGSDGCLSPTAMAREAKFYKKNIQKRLAELGLRIEQMSTDFDSCDSMASRYTLHAISDGSLTPKSIRRVKNLRERRKGKRKARLQARQEARAVAHRLGTWPVLGDADRTFSSDSEFEPEEPRPAPPRVPRRRRRAHPSHGTENDEEDNADDEYEPGVEPGVEPDVEPGVEAPVMFPAGVPGPARFRCTIGPETTVKQLKESLAAQYGWNSERTLLFAEPRSVSLDDSVVVSQLLSQSHLQHHRLSSIAKGDGVDGPSLGASEEHALAESLEGQKAVDAGDNVEVDAGTADGPIATVCGQIVASVCEEVVIYASSAESRASSAVGSASAAELLHSSLSATRFRESEDSMGESPTIDGNLAAAANAEAEATPPSGARELDLGSPTASSKLAEVSCIDVTLRRGFYQGKAYYIGVPVESSVTSTTKRASAGDSKDEPGADNERFCRICQCSEHEAPEMGRCVIYVCIY